MYKETMKQTLGKLMKKPHDEGLMYKEPMKQTLGKLMRETFLPGGHVTENRKTPINIQAEGSIDVVINSNDEGTVNESVSIEPAGELARSIERKMSQLLDENKLDLGDEDLKTIERIDKELTEAINTNDQVFRRSQSCHNCPVLDAQLMRLHDTIYSLRVSVNTLQEKIEGPKQVLDDIHRSVIDLTTDASHMQER